MLQKYSCLHPIAILLKYISMALVMVATRHIQELRNHYLKLDLRLLSIPGGVESFMIKIDPIASSSSGNCYHISDGNTPLLIECGVPVRRIQQIIGFTLSSIRGCLISHSHNDHACAVNDIMRMGIDCFMSNGTACDLGLKSSHRLKTIETLKHFRIGTWKIMAFETEHDADGSVGFLLSSGKNKVLFLTDTAYCRYKFKSLTHIMIECNHILDNLRKNVRAGIVSVPHKNRVMTSHFSLENVLEFFKANDLRSLQAVWLIHLSDDNSNEKQMKRAVQAVTGVPVYVCER